MVLDRVDTNFVADAMRAVRRQCLEQAVGYGMRALSRSGRDAKLLKLVSLPLSLFFTIMN